MVLYDRDGNGTLDKDEFSTMMRNLDDLDRSKKKSGFSVTGIFRSLASKVDATLGLGLLKQDGEDPDGGDDIESLLAIDSLGGAAGIGGAGGVAGDGLPGEGGGATLPSVEGASADKKRRSKKKKKSLTEEEMKEAEERRARKEKKKREDWRNSILEEYRTNVAAVNTDFGVRAIPKLSTAKSHAGRVREWQTNRDSTKKNRYRGNVSPYMAQTPSPVASPGGSRSPMTPGGARSPLGGGAPVRLSSIGSTRTGEGGEEKKQMKGAKAMKRRAALGSIASKAAGEKEEARKKRAIAAAEAALGGAGELTGPLASSQEFALSGRAVAELEGSGSRGRGRNRTLASLKSLVKRASRPSLGSLFSGLKSKIRLSLGSKNEVAEAGAGGGDVGEGVEGAVAAGAGERAVGGPGGVT